MTARHGILRQTLLPNPVALTLHTVTTLDSPGLAPYRTLRRPMDHLQRGIFVAEGAKVVLRLLDSPLSILSMLATPEWFSRIRGDLEGRSVAPVDVFLADSRLVNTIVGYRLHQGIMAIARVPPEIPLEALPGSHIVVALDGLNHAENVGVIVRTCAAFGVDTVIAGETSCSPFLRRAVRNSMGGVFKLNVVHSTNLVLSLRTLRRHHGTRVIAADANAPTSLAGHPFPDRVCIIAGNEDSGISPEVLAECDDRIAIPMSNDTDSLNVASALGVFLYELKRTSTP